MDELSQCRQCEAAFRQEPGDAGLCDSCREAQHPSIEGARAKKWSPLQLGLFSIVCDVMLIPSIMAITRGFGELRQVTRHEEAGVWRPEHERVRTGAVFGLLAGAARPAILALVFAAALASPPAGAREPFGSADELNEIYDALDHGDEEARRLAMGHFLEIGPTLTRSEAVLARLRALESDDSQVATTLLLGSLMSRDPTSFDDVRPLYGRVDADGKTAILGLAAHEGTGAAIEGMVELIEQDASEQYLEARDLAAVPQYAPIYLERLVALPDENPGHRLGLDTAQLLCEQDAPRSLFSPIQNALLFDWAQQRGALLSAQWGQRHPTVAAAAGAVRALGCLDGTAAGGALSTALDLPHPRVVSAAIEAMLRRSERPPSSVISRLAADPDARWYLFDALRRRSSVDLMPARTRTSRALADAYIRLEVPDAHEYRHVGQERRGFWGQMVDVHVYELGRAIEDGGRVAIGPFDDGRTGEIIQDAWSDEAEDPSVSGLADMVVNDWSGAIR